MPIAQNEVPKKVNDLDWNFSFRINICMLQVGDIYNVAFRSFMNCFFFDFRTKVP